MAAKQSKDPFMATSICVTVKQRKYLSMIGGGSVSRGVRACVNNAMETKLKPVKVEKK